MRHETSAEHVGESAFPEPNLKKAPQAAPFPSGPEGAQSIRKVDMDTHDCLHDRFIKKPDIVSRSIAGEHLLVPIRRTAGEIDSLFTLNEIAGRIWELVDGKKTVARIRDLIVEEFEVDRETAEADLIDFFRQLAEAEAVEKV